MPSIEDFLSTPSAPTISRAAEKNFTRQISISADKVEGEFRVTPELANEGTALAYLEQEGLNPEEWEATHFRKIKYGTDMESVKFSYKRKAAPGGGRLAIEALAAQLATTPKASARRESGDHGFIVALGDMQFGKIDGDGAVGSLARTTEYLERARDLLEVHRSRYDVGHVHIGWLGDHLEGFQSQGGANSWRTGLDLTDQLKLVRGVMAYGLKLFADSAVEVSMAAVPGNHGETVRFAGKGITHYSDSFDTDCLVAVSEAAQLNPDAFGHVKFYVPTTDEMVVVLDVAGTVVGHAHGHQWRPNKHFTWWQGQSFGGAQLQHADVLLAGHLHHFFIDSSGTKIFIQVPATEYESTWWRHATGEKGYPGAVTMITRNGLVGPLEVLR